MKTHPRALRQAFLTLICATLLGGCSVVASPPRELPSAPRPVDPGNSPQEGRERVPAERSGSEGAQDEIRALWVVRTTLTHPDSIRVMVERADRAGFNTLLVQVRGRGDAYYLSRWEPRPESVDRHGPSFDPLGLVIQEARARGLKVHAWVNAILVGGMGALPTDQTHLIRRRPDLLAVPRALARELYRVDPFSPRFVETILEYTQARRGRIEGLYTAPSHPEVKEHLYSVWMDLLEGYDLDGLHFDFIRYPNTNFDYSRGALERFREWVTPRLSQRRREALAVAYRGDPLAYVDALPGPWDEFRRNQLTDLVERIYYGVKKRDAGMVVSAAVFPDAEDAFRSRLQDWRGWVQAGILDAVAPMAYTPANEVYETQIRAAVEAVGGDRVWGGVGVYLNSYQGTLDKISIARELGARGVVLFSYDWAVSEGESDGDRSLLDRVGAEMFRRR